ncbi:MAG: pectinesterase family protein, partial [Myxococcota bacterium]|nr:pectinesterase family protein [Myxococcota bacterium]
PYGIVFLGGQLTAAPGVSNVALARPWRSAYAAVAFLNVAMGAHISSTGWTVMSPKPGVPDLSLVRFSEYKSTGAGANATARMAYQLTDAQAAMYTLPNLFAGWIPSLSH